MFGLFGVQSKRRVQVLASISYEALVLAPRTADFHHAYPDIDVQVTTAVWTDDVKEDTWDVEIRYGHGDWAHSNIHHLGHQVAEVVCSPAFAKSLPVPADFEALAAHAIPIIGSEADWRKMAEHLATELPSAPEGLKADSSLIALQILSGGVGTGLISRDFTKR